MVHKNEMDAISGETNKKDQPELVTSLWGAEPVAGEGSGWFNTLVEDLFVLAVLAEPSLLFCHV